MHRDRGLRSSANSSMRLANTPTKVKMAIQSQLPTIFHGAFSGPQASLFVQAEVSKFGDPNSRK